jgi:hypothetical protein
MNNTSDRHSSARQRPADPPYAKREKARSFRTIRLVMAVVWMAIAILLVAADLLIGNKYSSAQAGPYYLIACGMFGCAWGLAWGRIWTIPMAAAVTIGIGSWIFDIAIAVSRPGFGMNGAGLPQLAALMLVIILLAMIALQLVGMFILSWELVANRKRYGSPWPWLIEIPDLAIVMFIVPRLYQIDYTLPNLQREQIKARRAAVKAEDEAKRRDDAETQYALFLRFADAVESGNDEQKNAVWIELLDLDRQGKLWNSAEFARHTNPRVRSALLEASLGAGTATGDWRLFPFGDAVLRTDPDPKLRLRVVRYLIESENASPENPYKDHPLNYYLKESLPFFAEILQDQSDENVEARVRAVQAIGRERRYAERFLPWLNKIAQSDPDEKVRAASAWAKRSIEEGIDTEKNSIPYYGPQNRIELPSSMNVN